MSLFQTGEFRLHSGAISSWKIDCDALMEADIATLAEMVRILASPFRSVEGIPRGGVRLAEALRQYTCTYGPHLIVDDVLTTGSSMEHARIAHHNLEPGLYALGVVLFARGPCPEWIHPIFQLPERLWVKKAEG